MSGSGQRVAGGVTRRRFGASVGGALAWLAFGRESGGSAFQDADAGRIRARPRRRVSTAASGTRALEIGGTRDAILQIPAAAGAGALPLLVLLHGAGGTGSGILRRLGPVAEDAGVAVLAPDSRGPTTWDAIHGEDRGDIAFLNRALDRVFETVAVDPARVAVGGFSDGATYALALGLSNGDLFRRIVAFSPGFIIDWPRTGRPHVFISHGTADPILPIDRCGRAIASRLTRSGYEVTYREFEGGHTVPEALARESMRFATTVELPTPRRLRP